MPIIIIVLHCTRSFLMFFQISKSGNIDSLQIKSTNFITSISFHVYVLVPKLCIYLTTFMTPGPKVIKLFSCLTQLSMKIQTSTKKSMHFADIFVFSDSVLHNFSYVGAQNSPCYVVLYFCIVVLRPR